jgi:hypothetical protein
VIPGMRPGTMELRAGAVVLGFAALFYLMWYTDNSGHGERAFLLLPVYLLVPFGVGTLVCGIAERFSWPGRRWLPILPFALTAAVAGVLGRELGFF